MSLDITKIIEQLKYQPMDPLVFGTSLFFILFTCILGGLYLLRSAKELRILFLVLVSFFFYYKSAGELTYILLISACGNYLCGHYIFKAGTGAKRVPLLWIGIVLNLVLLGYFKYTNFFLQLSSSFRGGEFQPLQIILPLGLSYYTFKAISYLLDMYWEVIETEPRFTDFLLYFVYFPNLILGPIDRAEKFIPQIRQSGDTVLSGGMIGKAVFIIILGLLKKHVIADYIGINFVERVFDSPARFTGVENLLAIYAYALQLYCDFSGYTDLAIGVSLLMGFKLMENFNYPYRATSIADFWRRWHISLSSWLLDYLFRPLQMSMRRMKTAGNVLALVITFTLCGLWHGASINFVLWGAIHAFYMGFAVAVKTPKKKLYEFLRIDKIPFLPVLQVIVTFHLVSFAWIFFKVSDFELIKQIGTQMIDFFKPGVFPQFVAAYPVIFTLMVIGYLFQFLPVRLYQYLENGVIKLPLILQALLLTLIIIIVVQFRFEGLVPFIYFQF